MRITLLCRAFVLLAAWGVVLPLHAAQYSLESRVTGRLEYHDNIFVSTVPPADPVYGLVVTPNLRWKVAERHWETYLNARLRSNNYNTPSIDSNDVYLDWNVALRQERNEYSLVAKYNRDSNLNAQSPGFGIAGQRIKNRQISFSPTYRHIFSQNESLSLSVSTLQTDYDNVNVGYVPYDYDSASLVYAYGFSERDVFSLILQTGDYLSRDEAFEYQLYIFQLGIKSQLSEIWSVNASAGTSRRNNSNRTTQTFDFFGQPITLLQTSNFSSNGLVLELDVEAQWERSDFSIQLDRNDTANSFGGLNQVSSALVRHKWKAGERLSYTTTLRYKDYASVGQVARTTDRTVVSFEALVRYQLERDWTLSASYHRIRIQYDNVANNQADSNRIFLGMTYNFPDISVF